VPRALGLRALSTTKPAIRLYQRFGFREEGRLEDEIRLPDGGFADCVWCRRPQQRNTQTTQENEIHGIWV
jgi:ribosomal protein S18 acetylase RimI-like enzyme